MTGDDRDHAASFEVVTNATRVDILRALADAVADDPANPHVAYSDLQDAAGVRDNGNFNYHLDRLDGLVRKEPEGYVLSRPGMALLSTLSSGVFDPDWRWGPVDAPGECPHCFAPVELHYEDGILWLTCGDHETPLSVSPSLLADHPEEGVVERVAFLENRYGSYLRRGICPECQGRVDVELAYGGARVEQYHYRGECDRCGFLHGVPVGMYVLDHPAVVAFYHDHGVDVRTEPFWTLDFCVPGAETVLSEDPTRLQVEAECEGERLSVTLTADGTVEATECSPAPGTDAPETE
jgi:hypothetical protein